MDRTQEYNDLMDEVQRKHEILFNGEIAYWSRPHRWYDHRPWRWIAYSLIQLRNRHLARLLEKR